jgi:hypothetical protein
MSAMGRTHSAAEAARTVGFSDAEIIDLIGYLPRPLAPDEAAESEASVPPALHRAPVHAADLHPSDFHFADPAAVAADAHLAATAAAHAFLL